MQSVLITPEKLDQWEMLFKRAVEWKDILEKVSLTYEAMLALIEAARQNTKITEQLRADNENLRLQLDQLGKPILPFHEVAKHVLPTTGKQ